MTTAIHLSLFQHYAPKLEGLEVRTLGSAERFTLGEAFHHGKEAQPVKEFGAWFQPVWWVFRDAADWGHLLPLLEELLSIQEEKLGREHVEVAKTLDLQADILTLQARFRSRRRSTYGHGASWKKLSARSTRIWPLR